MYGDQRSSSLCPVSLGSQQAMCGRTFEEELLALFTAIEASLTNQASPFSVDEIRIKVYYLNASFLWLALQNQILACGNVIRISSPKLFFSMKARD